MSKRELSPDVEVVAHPQEPEHIRILRNAKTAIDRQDRWVTGAYINFDAHGYPVAFCMLGAMGRPHLPTDSPGFMDAAIQISEVVGTGIGIFNDHPSTTHADVMAAFDLAIEQATKDWLVAK